MYRALAGMMALAMASVALGGCESGGTPGSPGSITTYVHGRVVTEMSATTR
jgi:hypothetical protein